ncbi:hypothetical protein SeMB42_g04499 [Synchytrium endobioticum]|uniref:Uncharacterized protein n=1 Tax=Synchytrium endobioticum TaxID=286115 RepID=A0A507CXQ5_9FUNG|nr:hypothetical protein SeMB42_g04499 [Synchytrium endobioticum]
MVKRNPVTVSTEGYERHSASSIASSTPTLKDEDNVIHAATADVPRNAAQEVWENIVLTPRAEHTLSRAQEEEVKTPTSPNYLMHGNVSDDMSDIDNGADLMKDVAFKAVRGSASTVLDVASIMIGMDNEVIRIDDELADDDADTLLDVPLTLSRQEGRKRRSVFEENLDEIISRLAARHPQMENQRSQASPPRPKNTNNTNNHTSTPSSPASHFPKSPIKSKDFPPKSATTIDAVFSRFSWIGWTRAFEKRPPSIHGSVPTIPSSISLQSVDGSSKSSSSIRSRSSQDSRREEVISKPPKVHVSKGGNEDVKPTGEKSDGSSVIANSWDLDAVVGKLMQSPWMSRLDNQRVLMRKSPTRDKAVNVNSDTKVHTVAVEGADASFSPLLDIFSPDTHRNTSQPPSTCDQTTKSLLPSNIPDAKPPISRTPTKIPPRSASLNRLYLVEALHGHPAPPNSRSVAPITPPPRAVVDPDKIVEHQVIWELDEDGVNLRRRVVLKEHRRQRL